MKLEQQVVSLEFAKELKELGYPQESLFWYSPYVEIGGRGRPSFKLEYRTGVKSNREISISAPTVAELGIVLPNGYYSYRREYNDWWCIAVEEDGITCTIIGLPVELNHLLYSISLSDIKLSFRGAYRDLFFNENGDNEAQYDLTKSVSENLDNPELLKLVAELLDIK